MLIHRHIPLSYKGMRIGLYGGSFNPFHQGHRHIALSALKQLKLDQLWILVTPSNPLKNHANISSTQKRIEAGQKMLRHPKIHILDIETRLKTSFTADIIKNLEQKVPNRKFIWIMGADNLSQFHCWYKWRWMMENIEIAVFDRPEATHKSLRSKAAMRYGRYRILHQRLGKKKGNTHFKAHHPLPRWQYHFTAKKDISSTNLRAAEN